MNETKWTPGPWIIFGKQFHTDYRPVFVVYDANNQRIAECMELSTPRADGQTEHNARLISKAPEMAEALKEITLSLRNHVMTVEQENAFARNPHCEAWRVYLSGLIITARSQAQSLLNTINDGGDK